MRQFDQAVVIGRFQICHKGHEHLIEEALKVADKVLILVGSSFRSRTLDNPFNLAERTRMLRLVTEENRSRIEIKGISDHINNNQWIMEVQETIDSCIYSGYINNPKVCFVGHEKDTSTKKYLNEFPQYDLVRIESQGPIDASTLRSLYFNSEEFGFQDSMNSKLFNAVVSEKILKFLIHWQESEAFQYIRDESRFIKKYKEMWSFTQYEPTFVTTDAVVIESGHILLTRRGNHPGKDQWALPGGFLGEESLLDSCVRELHEETRLKVPKKVLKGSVVKSNVYDGVKRDPRGRFITHVYMFELVPCPDPKFKFTPIKAGDDAKHAEWIPLSKLNELKEDFFLDHLDIIKDMIG